MKTLHQEYLYLVIGTTNRTRRILLQATAIGISCFYPQNSATRKKIKFSFWEVLKDVNTCLTIITTEIQKLETLKSLKIEAA